MGLDNDSKRIEFKKGNFVGVFKIPSTRYKWAFDVSYTNHLTGKQSQVRILSKTENQAKLAFVDFTATEPEFRFDKWSKLPAFRRDW